mmetsp:Transcript_19173/g.57330  ORF Transcript_19173/g.57330 Transcript_19173/m.57330 type:complete len:255 (+) Transcript_19173:962-1726(+)
MQAEGRRTAAGRETDQGEGLALVRAAKGRALGRLPRRRRSAARDGGRGGQPRAVGAHHGRPRRLPPHEPGPAHDRDRIRLRGHPIRAGGVLRPAERHGALLSALPLDGQLPALRVRGQLRGGLRPGRHHHPRHARLLGLEQRRLERPRGRDLHGGRQRDEQQDQAECHYLFVVGVLLCGLVAEHRLARRDLPHRHDQRPHREPRRGARELHLDARLSPPRRARESPRKGVPHVHAIRRDPRQRQPRLPALRLEP